MHKLLNGALWCFASMVFLVVILIMFLSSGHFTSQRRTQRHSKSVKIEIIAEPWKGWMWHKQGRKDELSVVTDSNK